MNSAPRRWHGEGFQQSGVKRSKTPSTTPWQKFPQSPVFEPRDEDFTQFEASMKKYGVTSELTEAEKQINREKLRLLMETRIPLNNCGSKFVAIGLDPFNNFQVSVRILKQGFDTGAVFTLTTFNNLVGALNEVIINAREGNTCKINLLDYEVFCTQNKLVQFRSKLTNEVHLCVAESTLLRLREVQHFLFAKINSLDGTETAFNKFCENIVDDVANTIDVNVTDEIIRNKANSVYRDDLLIRELVCKFPSFVINAIYEMLDVSDRIKPYILNY